MKTPEQTALYEMLFQKLRCPDCHTALAPAGPGDGPFRCSACARAIQIDDQILRAVSTSLSDAARRNEAHYDTMAAQPQHHLERRGTTRNHRAKQAIFLEALGLNTAGPRQLVAEFGPGAGAHAAAVLERGHGYVGLDIAAGCLRRARAAYPVLQDGKLVAADVTSTPFQDAVVDSVFGVAVLHHLPEPTEGVRELLRLLKPGGRFCFLEPARFYPVHFYGYLKHPEVEVGTLKTTAGRIAAAARAHGAREVHRSRCIYTPNRPLPLVPIYDVIDRFCETFAPLRALSVMFCVYGSK